MGCTEHVNFCPTCKLDIHKCSGHYGYIKLNKWFIHPSFKNPTLYCLRCICHYCGQTYITKEILEASGIKTKGIPGLKERAELSDKFHSCHKCPPMFFDYNKEFKNGYIVTYKQNNATMQQSIENIDKIFSTISKEGIELLGFEEKSEPKNFIMKDLMVTPSLSRPTIHIENLVRHDYISLCYADIISKNNELKHRKDSRNTSFETITTECELYDLIDALINGSEKRNVTKSDKGGSFSESLSKKKGYLRQNAMGKRVNQCGRTVAGPGSRANHGQLLVPQHMCNILTVPEKVTKYNIDKLSLLIKNVIAKYITYNQNGTNQIFAVNAETAKTYNLQIGDIITRPLDNGDPVLNSRQPILHAESIMGQTVEKHDLLTFGHHSSTNAPHNLDFDGDETNIHAIQEIKAQVETLNIANVKFHVMNIQANKPMMGLAYNSPVAAYLMTMKWLNVENKKITVSLEKWNNLLQENPGLKDEKMSKERYLSVLSTLLGKNLKYNESMIPEEKWESAISSVLNNERKDTLEQRCEKHNVNIRSARALFSLVFPINFCHTVKKTSSKRIYVKNGNHEIEEILTVDETIIIKDGIVISGTLNKDTVGTSVNSLVQILNKLYSFKEACYFNNTGQKLCDWYITWHSLSIGFKDIEGDRKRIYKLLILMLSAV